MTELLLHPKTKASLQKTIEQQTHAILIAGELGAGKNTIARFLASKLLSAEDVAAHPYFLELAPEGKAVSIDQIRELNRFLQLKVPGSSTVKRVVLVLAAETMTIEAQNALLKTLEEPPADTVIILTTHSPQVLLPTIHSRVQTLPVHSPTAKAAKQFWQHYSPSEVERAYSLSNGQAGLMTALLSEDKDHVLLQSIALAKELYRQTPYQRLCQVESLTKQKDQLQHLLYASKRIAASGLQAAAGKDDPKQAKAWSTRLSKILNAEEALSKNANAKLVLTDLLASL